MPAPPYTHDRSLICSPWVAALSLDGRSDDGGRCNAMAHAARSENGPAVFDRVLGGGAGRRLCSHAFADEVHGIAARRHHVDRRAASPRLRAGPQESALVEEAVANGYNSTAAPNIRRDVITWGLKAIPDVQAATVHEDPLVALGDQWALGLQTEAFAREGPGRARFGAAYVFVERAGRQMAYESERVATLVFGANGVASPRDQIVRWAQANPIASATFARPSASTAWARALGGKSHSALGFIASADDRLTLLSARMAMMNDTLLDRVRWTSELIVRDSQRGERGGLPRHGAGAGRRRARQAGQGRRGPARSVVRVARRPAQGRVWRHCA